MDDLVEGGGVRLNDVPFTVAVPAYNESRRIGALLSFLENELSSDVPILVVNDGSTDGTTEILKAFEPRIQVFNHEVNMGYAMAFDDCLAEAPTDVVVILDADSLPTPGSIGRLVEAFRDPHVGAASGVHVLMNERRGIVNYLNHVIYRSKMLLDLYQASRGNFWHMNGLIMGLRRSCVPTITNKETNQDAFLGWLTLNRGHGTAFIPTARCRFKAPSTVQDIIRSRGRVCRGHVVLGEKYGVSPHTFTEVAFPLYCSFVIRAAAPLKIRGGLAMVFGAILDMSWRTYWLLKYRVDPSKFNAHRWKQIESTKHW